MYNLLKNNIILFQIQFRSQNIEIYTKIGNDPNFKFEDRKWNRNVSNGEIKVCWVISVTSMCPFDDLNVVGDLVLVIWTPDADHGKGYELVCFGDVDCVTDIDRHKFGDHRFTWVQSLFIVRNKCLFWKKETFCTESFAD